MSTKSRGELAMKHARAWVKQRHPGALSLEAKPQRMRVPSKTHRGEVNVFNKSEDHWGVFDLIVFPVETSPFIELIQVTSVSEGKDALSAVYERKKKVGDWIVKRLSNRRPGWCGGTYVIGWVPRQHFLVWRWNWAESAWSTQPSAPAPLTTASRSSASGPALLPGETPFD